MNRWHLESAKTQEDILWILGELPKFAAYHAEESWLPDWDAQMEQLIYAMRHGYLRIAISPDGNRSGFLMGCTHPHWSNREQTQATELLWWVVPEARKTRAGFLLMRDFTAWAESFCHKISFSLVGPAGDRALMKLGYKYGERVYTKEVQR